MSPTQKHRRFVARVVLVTGLSVGWASQAHAVIVTTSFLPPPTPYVAQFHANYGLGFLLRNIVHRGFINVVVVVIGADEQETFDSTLDAVVDFGGGNTVPVTLTGPVVIRVSGRALNPTGTFATEIVSMSLTGNLGGQTVEIRESPSQASLGETTVTDLGGGLFDVDSFFDPFTEISIDGGPFIADQNGPSHIQNIIPSPGAALLALIGLGAARRIRRRRRVARA